MSKDSIAGWKKLNASASGADVCWSRTTTSKDAAEAEALNNLVQVAVNFADLGPGYTASPVTHRAKVREALKQLGITRETYLASQATPEQRLRDLRDREVRGVQLREHVLLSPEILEV